MVDASNKLSVIAFNPNPTEKLSKDTPNANNNIPNLFNDISLFEGFIYSINIWSEISKRIIPNIKSVSIDKYLVIWNDIIKPNKGIIKWNIPTVKLVINVFFIDKLYIPMTVDIEKASILRQVPIINNIRSSFIKSPY